jgi:hypothetical protein
VIVVIPRGEDKVNNGMAVFLAGQKSDSDDFTDIEDDGSGGNVDADDDEWSVVSSS